MGAQAAETVRRGASRDYHLIHLFDLRYFTHHFARFASGDEHAGRDA